MAARKSPQLNLRSILVGEAGQWRWRIPTGPGETAGILGGESLPPNARPPLIRRSGAASPPGRKTSAAWFPMNGERLPFRYRGPPLLVQSDSLRGVGCDLAVGPLTALKWCDIRTITILHNHTKNSIIHQYVRLF